MRYSVKAMRGEAVIDLELEARDALAAREEAARQGYDVLTLRERGYGLASRFAKPSATFPTAVFTEQLVTLLDAGLNIVEGLQALALKETVAPRRRVIEEVLGCVRQGESFSQAIAKQPKHFTSVYAAIVQASERSGNLKQALERYLDYERKFEHVRAKLVSALLYPAVLTVVGGGVLLFLMFYVVPRFARIYEDLSGNLPFFSRLLLTAGGAVERNAWPVAAVAIALAAFAGYSLSRRDVREGLARRLWRMPAIGEQLRIYQLARMYATLGMLLRSGIPIVASISMTTNLLSAALRPQLARAQRMIEEGASISGAMSDCGLSTAVADQMLAVGERGGRMGEMMERAAAFCDDDIARWLDWAMRMFEPLLMAALGLGIGLIVVLMYMPVFELAGSLQ